MNDSIRETQRIHLQQEKPSPFLQIFTALMLGILFFFILVCSFLLCYQLINLNRIYPGVTVNGIDLGGLNREEAILKISKEINYPVAGRITFVDQDQAWDFTPMELGFFLDSEVTIDTAMQIGRGSFGTRLREQYLAVYYGRPVTPTFLYNEQTAFQMIDQIRPVIDLETIEATLEINDLDVVAAPGQDGRFLDGIATLVSLEPFLLNLENAEIPLVVNEFPAGIIDATEEAELARTILSQEFEVVMPSGDGRVQGPWSIQRETLSQMLMLKRVDDEDQDLAHYNLGIDERMFFEFLAQFSDGLTREPANPRFIFNDDTHQLEVLQSAVIGREVDAEMTLAAMEEAILNGEHSSAIDFEYHNPPVTDDSKGTDIGITELVHAETSYFYGSDSARVQNIKTSASEFHGILVPPNTNFSMAAQMDDITLDNGYAEAWIIYGDQTIKGVGGGVCQVSTTLFRTAFFAGFPVLERHPHAYRVYYYEKEYGNSINTNLAGLDATVYLPVVDLVFTNDTDNWLLIETYVIPSSSSITFKFYSTSDNRSVNWSTTGLTDIEEEPEPVYHFNDELSDEQIKQVDWGIAGGKVTVYREVLKDGAYYFDDTFYTHYQAWRDVYEYGKDAELPEDAIIE
ncbi:MAG: VanW family protein [Anaerolineaceae bacterium]|nr:VanW family protein [Anaerolineaceae bacterium]